MNTPDEQSANLRKSFGSLERRSECAKDALKRLHKLSGDFEKSAFEAGALVSELRGLRAEIETGVGELSDLGALLDHYEGQVREAKKRMSERLGHGISEGLSSLGLPVAGRFPELSAGPIFMTFKPEKGKVFVCLGDGGPVLEKVDIDVEKIVKSVDQQYTALFKDEFDTHHFVELVRQAITRANRVAERASDAPVPMDEMLLELNVVAQAPGFAADPSRARFKAYTRLMAAVHLFRARPLQGDGYELRLVVATREQTRSKSDHLYIPTDLRGHGTHFAAVQLKRRSP